jgi:RNA polymerase sigma factor (sigma-70 family)
VTDTIENTSSRTMGERLQAGDVRAFEAFYEDLHPMVFNLAARITGDREAGQDITQDVFLKSFRAFPETKGELRPEAWIVKTTVNACLDHLRRASRRAVSPLNEAPEPAARHDAFEQSATVEVVEATLARINPKYRTAILLKDLQGLSNGEVAAAMGVGRGNIGVLLFRARGAFKKAYREAAAGGAILPAGLVAVLPQLPVPEAIATPPFDGATATAAFADVAGPSLAAGAEPFLGMFARLLEPLSSKVAVVAAAAVIAAGAGVAAGTHAELASQARQVPAVSAPADAHAQVTTAQAGSGAEMQAREKARFLLLRREAISRYGDGTGDSRLSGSENAGGGKGNGGPASSSSGRYGSGSGGAPSNGDYGTGSGEGGTSSGPAGTEDIGGSGGGAGGSDAGSGTVAGADSGTGAGTTTGAGTGVGQGQTALP